MPINFTLVHNGKTNDEADDTGDVAAIAVTGWLHFVGQMPEGMPALADGTSYWIRTFKGYLDTDGVLKNEPGGTAGVRIWANDPAFNLEDPGLPYLVYAPNGLRANGKIVPFTPFVFYAPSTDIEKKFTDLQPVPSATAEGISRGPEGWSFAGLADVDGHPAQKQPMVESAGADVPAGDPVDFTDAIHDGIVTELEDNTAVVEAAEAAAESAVGTAIQGRIGSGLHYKGQWNASTNAPTLVDGTGTAGDQWIVKTAGTRNLGSGSQVFAAGDSAVYNGTIWERVDKALLAVSGQFVQIGSDANYPRSGSAVLEVFAATVEPNNALDGDFWADYSGTQPTVTTTVLSSLAVGVPTDQVLAASGSVTITGYMGWTVSAGTPPAGLSLSSSGELSGTPTTAGAYDFTVRAENGYGADTQQYTGTVGAAVLPTITTTSLGGTPTAGVAYSQALLATGSVPITWAVNSGTLPDGLSLNPSTGVVSGSPTADGAYSFTVRATNAAGYDDQAFTGTISGAAPVITTSALASLTQLNPFSQTLAVTGTTPIAWSDLNGTLPAGLSINSSTGQIFGNPSSAGAYDFTIRATNTYGHYDKQYTGTIASAAPVITTASLNPIYRGVAFSQTLAATGATPITWSKASGTYPSGITVDSTTGVLSGTPSATGAFSFTARATNSVSTGDQAYSGSVLESTPTITETVLNSIQVGVAFSQTLHATGYAPFTWTVSVGTLPAGLSLNSSTGVISGTPTTAGSYSFTIRATNGISGFGSQAYSGSVGAVLYDNNWGTVAQAINASSYSGSYTATLGADVFVAISTGASGTAPAITAITYNGVAMTQVGTTLKHNNTDVRGYTALYRAAGAGLGSAATLAITFAASSVHTINVGSYKGVGSLGTVVTATGNSTTPSTGAVTCPTNGMILAVIGGGSNIQATITSSSGGNARASGTNSPQTYCQLIVRDDSASNTFAAVFNTSQVWSCIAVPLNP